MTGATATADQPSGTKNFDDVMLAMDIVDTLRHRERIVDKELGTEAREAALIKRLREIYQAQGIEVPDRILKDGVKALEEKRFVYEPAKGGFGHALARIYVARGRWMKPLGFVLGLAAFSTAVYEFGYDNPREARIEREQIELTQTLPASLASERDKALALAETDDARTRIETVYQNGVAAAEDGSANNARNAVGELKAIAGDLSKDLTIRVISRPGEMSGVFRVHDDFDDVKNYYLIVEAVDANGAPQSLVIASEEDQTTKRVEKWGVRVTEGEFNRVAADKQDDQIIQNAVIGRKPKGALTPAYSIATAGGEILEW